MKLLIEIPDKDIPKGQDMLEIDLCFVGGQVGQCTYPFEVLQEEEKTGHCKDCKWWKDSDGIYRRGARAESSCPFNTKEIYDGDAYCYRFAPQERIEKE